jgi:putative spermidine/putrescine transport system permease protein
MTEDTSTQFPREFRNRTRMGSIIVALLPYVLLVLISVGTGWSFPVLVPERIDCSPWLRFLADRDRLGEAVVTSLLMSLIVGVVGTACGLWVGRAVRQSAGSLRRFLVYLPFVLSPVIVGISLYDLMVRVNLSSTYLGTVLVQLVFATSLAGVYFSELWTTRIDRLEQLVKSLGGGRWSVFRHATWPEASRLIAVCFFQTALFSWLDYGLVTIIGGGQVRTLTVRLFGFLREASINQAAQAAIVLLVPTFLGFATSIVLLRTCRTPSQEPVR